MGIRPRRAFLSREMRRPPVLVHDPDPRIYLAQFGTDTDDILKNH